MKEYQTQQEQIDALGGKIVVKRRDYEAADRITQRELSRNEATIVRLRDQVKRKRKALAAMLHKDKDVVKNALSDPKHRFQRLQFRSCDGEMVKDELNEDLCNEIKKLNQRKYQKQCKEKRLADLRTKLNGLKLMQGQADVVETDEKEVRRLKGEVEKMVVRRNTAKYINSVYQKSLRELTKTRPNVEHELDQYEKELNMKTVECDELRQISDKILLDRDQTRGAAVAEATYLTDLRVARDCTLKNTTKQVRRDVESVPSALQSRYTRDTQNDILGTLMARNTHKASVLRNTSCSPLPSIMRPPGPAGDSLEAVKATMEGVQGVTATSKPREIAQTFEREMNKYQRLINQASGAIQALEANRELHSETQERLNQIKYNQKTECDQLQSQIGQLTINEASIAGDIDAIDNQTSKTHVDLLKAAEAIEIIGQKLEPDRVHGAINLDMENGDLVENALDTLGYIEQLIQVQRDDVGDEFDPHPQYDQQTKERLFNKYYDDAIGISPMKRIVFDSAIGPDAGSGKGPALNFDELDAEEMMNNEHYVSHEAIKSMARRADCKGRKTKVRH